MVSQNELPPQFESSLQPPLGVPISLFTHTLSTDFSDGIMHRWLHPPGPKCQPNRKSSPCKFATLLDYALLSQQSGCDSHDGEAGTSWCCSFLASATTYLGVVLMINLTCQRSLLVNGWPKRRSQGSMRAASNTLSPCRALLSKYGPLEHCQCVYVPVHSCGYQGNCLVEQNQRMVCLASPLKVFMFQESKMHGVPYCTKFT